MAFCCLPPLLAYSKKLMHIWEHHTVTKKRMISIIPQVAMQNLPSGKTLQTCPVISGARVRIRGEYIASFSALVIQRCDYSITEGLICATSDVTTMENVS
jgi:hypothetical protein